VGIDGARILVVGASSGIGRAITERALARGAHVAMAARRAELLERIGTTAGSRAVPLTCDVSDAGACVAMVDDAIARLGGLDALVYAAGCYRLVTVADASPADWEQAFAVNVIGAAMSVKTALSALRESRGRAVFLSSEVVGQPRAGVVAYGSSKAALDHLVRGLRTEVDDVSFTSIVIGATGETDLGRATPRDTLSQFVQRWERGGFRIAGMMPPSAVADEVLHVIDSDVRVFTVEVQPRPQDAGSA
jgi:NAD(P)-dependent dehydrogenase (short-subunit alcohol dehydrogenase family)